jgi:hypothetical protein
MIINQENLIKDFNKYCRDKKILIINIDGYKPTGFIQLVGKYGFYGAFKQCLKSKTYGFGRLYEINRLDESVEYYICEVLKDTPYFNLFTQEEKNVARKRLIEHNFDFKSKSIKIQD